MRLTERRQKFSQKKSLGQVFLREDWPCRKMVEQLKKHHVQYAIEIGPGPGILTKLLLSAGINVLAIEKDDRLADRLEEQNKQFDYPGKLEILNQDILKFDLGEWVEAKKSSKAAICGNIPYNISSPILMWLLPYLDQLSLASLMVQLEFGERVASSPSTKSYGSLTVYTQLRSKVQLDFKVPRTAFYPVPKVDSAVITMKPLQNKESELILKKVEQVSRKAFSQRRKKLSNSLSAFLKAGHAQNLPIDLSRRVDTVSPQEFVALVKSLGLENEQEQ
ncbi:MAG: ribosomal RNA small subunit methyltransferase A [Oligoflexales bacterium]|nr:ribosomal RNA small subunit methyltransferase A [Oligoflexales bacterium]